MLTFSPHLFATLVTGAFRLNRVRHEMRINRLIDEQDIRVLVPLPIEPVPDTPAEEVAPEIHAWICRQLMLSKEYEPGRAYEGVFQTAPGAPAELIFGDGNLPLISPGHEALFETALVEKVTEHQRRHNPDIHAREVQENLEVFQLKALTENPGRSPWGEFFEHVVDVGFDLLSAEPSLLGLKGNLESFVTAFVPVVADAFDPVGNPKGSMVRGLAEAFSEAALQTLVDNPNLVVDEARWQPLITGVLKPLQYEVNEHGLNGLFAERRIRELVGGPVAHGALTALSDNADAFFTGRASGDTVMGAIVRETLGVAASASPSSFKVRSVFTDDGALKIMGAALSVAKRRPDLFVDQDDLITDAGRDHARTLIARFANVFLSAPIPFKANKHLAVTLACESLEVLGDYTSARLSDRAGDDEQGQVRADMAAHLVGDLLTGFSQKLQGENADLLERVFSRDQLIDVMKIMASHVSRSPHAFISDHRNPQVVAMAEAVAEAIASDTSGLMSGEDWRTIIVVAMDAGLRNPGRLFAIDPTDPKGSIALHMIRRLLQSARDGLAAAPDQRGQLMFGRTLSLAVRGSLSAAANGTLSLLQDEDELVAHINEVGDLADRLNALGRSTDRSKVISADEWMSIFTYYVAHVLENGPGSVAALSDDDLLEAASGGFLPSPSGA